MRCTDWTGGETGMDLTIQTDDLGRNGCLNDKGGV
jgi:hypothetical protein